MGVERAGSGFRPATPNRKGQFSDAVLNELESQNESQVEGIMGKVKVLKEVCSYVPLDEEGSLLSLCFFVQILLRGVG